MVKRASTAPKTPPRRTPLPEAPVEVRLLGIAAWRRPGQAPVKLINKDALLIAMLALEGPQARHALMEMLWPTVSPKRAAWSLRQRTSRLNRAACAVMFGRDDPLDLLAHVKVDAADPARLSNEFLLQAGSLLQGIEIGDHAEADLWLSRARLRVRDACAQVLAGRAEALEHEGRLREALPLAQRVAELLPHAEHATRRVMRLHHRRADRGEAQEAYWRLRQVLHDDLGVPPSGETMQLLQTVEMSEPAPLPGRRPVPASVLRPPVLVGRTLAWQSMLAAWRDATPFAVLGEAGIGKSRLIADFVAGHEGVHADRAQPGDEAIPYAVLGRLLLAIDLTYAPNLSRPLRVELARVRPELGVLPRSPASTALVLHAVGQLLVGAMARGLKAIIVDDFQNADVATVEALRWLCALPALATLRVGVAARIPGPHSPLAAWLHDSRRPVPVELAPLPESELGELLSTLGLHGAVDAAFTAKLFRHAGGHPLFTLATLHEAIARGSEFGSAQMPRPRTIEVLLEKRIHQLGRGARALLDVAAVAGPDFDGDLAAAVLGRRIQALANAWRELEAAQVLVGESFSHDLMHGAALRAVSGGLQRTLHRRIAAHLEAGGSAAPARVAWHWEEGGRWANAGRRWHEAAEAARLAGRLAEQDQLFLHSADCHARCDDRKARFEALVARLPGLQLRSGGRAVLAALPDVEALAGNGEERLRCRLARIEALLDDDRWEQALPFSEQATADAATHSAWIVCAACLHAQTLAQAGRFEEGAAAAASALARAEASGDAVDRLKAFDATHYVHYRSGELAKSLVWLRRAKAQAETIGFRSEAAEAAGNVVALLAAIGDVVATHAEARACKTLFQEIGLAENSTFNIALNIQFGAAAAARGHFDEGLDALRKAVEMSGPDASTAARGKARLTLANVMLTLGQADEAYALLDELPRDLMPAMRMQAELVRARAHVLVGRSPTNPLRALAQLGDRYPDLPIAQSAWYELSFANGPEQTIRSLQRARAQFEAAGLAGTARSLHLRELARWLEIDTPQAKQAALGIAERLVPHALELAHKCHPPDTLCLLYAAFGRAGADAGQAECSALAARWLAGALRHVPATYRNAFEKMPGQHHWLAGQLS